MHLHTHCNWGPNHYCVSDQPIPAFVQNHSQNHAKLVFVISLEMDISDCTNINAHFTACLQEGLIH